MAAGTALTAATTAPVAAADVIFVRCSFSVDQPFVYELNGASYVGARMRADNCETNLPSTPLKFGLDIQAGYGSWPAAGSARTSKGGSARSSSTPRRSPGVSTAGR